MSADFTKILVKDDRLEVVDNIKYAVVKGGQNVTMAQFQAISQSSSQIVFNIQVPSEQTIIDRRVMLVTDLTLQVASQCAKYGIAAPEAPATFGVVTGAAPSPSGGCGYGSFASLAPYPLHQLITVASATINNNTVSINIRDVLPFIIRSLEKGDLNAYNGMTATSTDSYLSYLKASYDSVGAPTGGGVPTLDTDLTGRGSIALKSYSIANSATSSVETFTWRITEPLMLSPFIYCNPKSNSQGFYGIQNMNFVLNIGSTDRVFRGLFGVDGLLPPVQDQVQQPLSSGAGVPSGNFYASPAGSAYSTGALGNLISLPQIVNVSLPDQAFANTALLFTFLTPHPSDLMPARNIVPYYELPRYITNVKLSKQPTQLSLFNSTGVPVGVPLGSVNALYTDASKTSSFVIPFNTLEGEQVPSQTLQLNQIPDKLVIFVRKPLGQQKYGDSDAFLPIRSITINFNNNSGILSSARTQDLYRMSKDNGSNQSWNEWCGYVNTPYTTTTNSGSLIIPKRFPGSDTTVAPINSSFVSAATVGSCLMLEFGKDIQLVEDFFAPGSLGNFNIQVTVAVENNNPSISTSETSILGNAELVMITMNSGVFVCERGTSSTYTGILTRADVLEASEQDAYSRSDVKRMVGGGFLDMLKSGVSKLAPLMKAVAPMLAPMAKQYLGSKGAMGKLAAQGIGALGYGSTGCGISGSGISGSAHSGGMRGCAHGGAMQGRYM